MFHQSFYILATLLPSISIAVPPPPCSVGPHAGKTISESIPFINNPTPPFPFDKDPKVHGWFTKTNPTTGVEGAITRSYQFSVDTGSTGVMISDTQLDDWLPSEAATATPGYEYLSSSKLLYSGYWVNRNMYFNKLAPATNVIKTQIKVLVVTSKCQCTTYIIGSSGATCPGGCTPQAYDQVRMMGIGFGRTIDGMEGGTPDKNPILNVVSIHGTAVNTATYHPGYIIDGNGITVGLTSTNYDAAGFGSKEVPLPPPATEPSGVIPRGHYPWDMMLGCVQVNSIPSPCLGISVLLDTGLEQSYIRVPVGTTWFGSWPKHFDGNRTVLNTNAHVDVAFGRPRLAETIYSVGDFLNEVTPIWTNVYSDPRPSFVNTGSHAFRKYEVAYDPICGKQAFR
ncbi:hypothetical protein GLAREA_05249 [Glarea lozoyensis ATCC 20868]|uniref:Acid protease n=2 Tax=Glarea lozoyensis TaxID=101852 RepID=S3DVE5_GLAL2|nr:uncharacterized protein GLAREA_05249 [Glarea lozoyensis ATCC 20868]EHK99706.1 hypothetical protein M7I_4383 [Glarea lozoyensis 74030]EPE35911.1 hypothetical protein GLAREA_05249 [Glarea lozoyensis ATCC 20868]